MWRQVTPSSIGQLLDAPVHVPQPRRGKLVLETGRQLCNLGDELKQRNSHLFPFPEGPKVRARDYDTFG